MPGVSSPPVLVNRDPTQVSVEYLGAAPGLAGSSGIVAERVGHLHALGRAQRAVAGMGLYADVDPTHDGCDAYLTTAAGALPSVNVWTWETWFLGPTGANVTYSAGIYAQGTSAPTANPNGLLLGLVNSGGGGGPTVFRCPDGATISLGVLSAIMYHVAAVYNGVIIAVYLNGALQGTHTPSSSAAIPANQLAGFGASATNASGGRMRLGETRLSNIPRFTAPFTPQETPYTPDSATVGLWTYSDLPLGNWGVFYETGGTSPAPGGQPLPAGWHWTPSATFDSGPNGIDLGVSLHLYTIIADLGSVIYSAGPAGITAADAVLRSPTVTSLNAQNGDLVLEDQNGNQYVVTPGGGTAAGVITIPAAVIDTNAGDIQPVAGTAAAGSSGKIPDAGHQHVGVHSVTAGTNVTIGGTASDPVINASGGGGGGGSSAFASATQSSSASTTATSTTYAGLSTAVTQTVTVPASGRVWVSLLAELQAPSGNELYVSVALSGANTVAASDGTALRSDGITQDYSSYGRWLFTGLTAGSTTFTVQYRVSGGSGLVLGAALTLEPVDGDLGIPVDYSHYALIATHTGAQQNLTQNVTATVTLVANQDASSSFASNTYTCPKAGLYQVTGSVLIQGTGSGPNLSAIILQNGTIVYDNQLAKAGNGFTAAPVAGILKCAAGDTITLGAQSNESGDNVPAGNPDKTYLCIAYLGPGT